MDVYFINDTRSSSNWGCRGTTRTLRRLVEQHGGTITDSLSLHEIHTPRPLASLLPGLSERSARLASNVCGFEERALTLLRQIPGTSRRDAWKQYESIRSTWDTLPLRFREYDAVADRVEDGELFVDQRDSILDSDIVLINGEGSIYDRQRKGRALLFFAYLAADRLDTETALVNHTAAVQDPVMRELASQVYPLLDDVVFREPVSARACAPFLPGSPGAYLGADAAFTYEPVDDMNAWNTVVDRDGYFDVWPDTTANFQPSEPYTCVGGSSIYHRPDRPEYDPIPALAALCERLQSACEPVLLTASCRSDAELLRPIADALSLPLVGPHTPVQQAVDLLGNAAAYVGGRWHPSIYALTGGTPVVTLTANTHKTTGLVELAGLDAPTFDALSLADEVDDIVALTTEYIDRGDDLRNELTDRAETLSADAQRNVDCLQ